MNLNLTANPRWTGRRRWMVTVAVVAVLAVVAVIMFRGDGDGDPATRRPILIVGDSVTALTAEDLNALYGEPNIQILARWGYRTDQLLPLVRDAEGRPAGRRIALLVGYNDVFERTVDTAPVADMMDESSRFRCAVWMTLPARTGGSEDPKPPFDADLVRRWNERLTSEAARHSNVHVVRDWERLVDDDTGTRLIEARGVHPEPPGQLELAAIYRTALDRECDN